MLTVRNVLAATGVAIGLGVLGVSVAAQTGTILLPNDWRIAAPPGNVGTTGTLPQGIVLSHDGARAFVVDAGYGPPGLRIIDTKTLATTAVVPLKGAFGVPLRDVADDGVWVATAGDDAIVHIDTANAKVDRRIDFGPDFYATSVARSPDGTTLAVTGELADRVAFVNAKTGAISATYGTDRHPKAVVFAPDGASAFVASWEGRSVNVVNLQTGTSGRTAPTITVGLHPDALVSDGKRVFVANADDDTIATIDIAHERTTAVVSLGLGKRVGASPNNLLLDGDRLYVTCGAANVVAVMRVTDAGLTPLGAIPAGWYPTAVAVDHATNTLYVVNGKGEGGHANPDYKPLARVHQGDSRLGYIAANLAGSVRALPIPSDAELAADEKTLATLGAPYANAFAPASPILRSNGPIKHVIYIVKENRTYDQILGDVPHADGDPAIVMFGANVTPNQHALVERFGVFDRFFDNAHVSADGHNWSMAAFANDYLEKSWPAEYSGRRKLYDFEDGADASVPHAGYLWDLAARSHVRFRNYGEFASEGPTPGSDVTFTQRTLADNSDPHFPTFDMSIRDVDRVREWKREYDAFEKTGTAPQLTILRLPRDHTSGTRPGQVTPAGMVADNDLAVGQVVDIVSHSPDWKSTAIFILEDDAQNGPDHVDEQRSTFYLVSPYAKGGTQHEVYTTASVIRTIELILGMPPLTPYDAGARPLTDAFTTVPDLQPFRALPPRIDTNALNMATSYRAHESAQLDFSHEDRVPDAVLNDILWGAVKGARSQRPPYGAFDASPAAAATRKSDDD
jgi:DNA-binding beta-propeller fold protein YncE